MRYKALLALYVGASLSVFSTAAWADGDDDDSDDAANAMQVMLDEDGEILEREDDTQASRAATSAADASTGQREMSAWMPQKSEAPQHHSDGSVSARMGLDHLEYLTVTQNEDGELVYSHVPAEQVEAGELPAPDATEEK